MNSIRKRISNQSRRNLGRSAFLEGKLSNQRGDSLASLILRGWREWPGNDRERSQLIAVAVIGFLRITEGRR
jgi:hypothetical protein